MGKEYRSSYTIAGGLIKAIMAVNLFWLTAFNKNKMENIKNILKAIEEKKGIKILYACETGSRAWGFPSPDSD
jgi:hypothetical protein